MAGRRSRRSRRRAARAAPGPSAHSSKLPSGDGLGDVHVSTGRSSPSEPPMYRSLVPTWAMPPSVRGPAARARPATAATARPRRPAPGRAGLVLGGAEVDRRPDEHAEVDGPVDGQVVRPVGDVAEHQDDDHQPDPGLDAGPRPAVRVEQPEQRALARDRPARAELLGHRPRLALTTARQRCRSCSDGPCTRTGRSPAASGLDLDSRASSTPGKIVGLEHAGPGARHGCRRCAGCRRPGCRSGA